MPTGHSLCLNQSGQALSMKLRPFALAVFCFCALEGTVARAQDRAVPTIFDFVQLWLAKEHNIVRDQPPPHIVAMSYDQLYFRRFGTMEGADGATVEALYDAESNTIFVSDNWSGGSIADLSVLVHEMVHHLQAKSGWIHACPAEREKLAYQVQDEFLQMFGQSLQSTFNIDPALILVATSCLH